MDDEFIIYQGEHNYTAVERFVGRRPGDKKVDPFYVKKGWGNKTYFWDGRWILLHPGDMIYKRADGSVALERNAA